MGDLECDLGVFLWSGEPLKVFEQEIAWPDLGFKDDLSGCKGRE